MASGHDAKHGSRDAFKQATYRRRQREKLEQMQAESQFAARAKTALAKGIAANHVPYWVIEESGQELENLLKWIAGETEPPRGPLFKTL